MEETEIPLRLAELVGQNVAYKGLFVIWPNQKLSELTSVKLEALKNYKVFLDQRIEMEQKYYDERKKAGVSVDLSNVEPYNTWVKWSNEIAILLKESNTVKASGSFMDFKEYLIDEPKVEVVKKKGKSDFQQEASL